MNKDELRKWRKSMNYFCTQCHNPVRLKVGEIVIPHFAHEVDTSCSSFFSEGESTEHLKGKQQLYDFFLHKVKEVKLEPYFKSLAQRPDLLITYNGERIPIEFQCSSIPIVKIKSRTEGFNREGMKPIWLLNTPEKLKKSKEGIGVFYLSKFEKTFITKKFLRNPFLLTYNPHSEQFHYVHSLLQIAGKRYIGIHRTLCKSKQVFPFAEVKDPTYEDFRIYARHYLSIRKKFLNNRVLLNRRGIKDMFLRGCYDLHIRPPELPLWIGVPMTSLNPFPVDAVEWQLLFIYFFKKRERRFNEITKGELYNFVKQFDGISSKQVEVCIKYRLFLHSIHVKSIKDDVEFGEIELANYIESSFLAK